MRKKLKMFCIGTTLLIGGFVFTGCDVVSKIVVLGGGTSGAPAMGTSKSAYTTSDGRVKGFADLHIHMFAEHSFGGGWLHGNVVGAEKDAMRRCSGNLGDTDHAATRLSLLNEFLGQNGLTDGDTGWHWGKRRGFDERKNWFLGYPREHYEHWPSWDSIAHQQVWENHLEQSYKQGMRLMVMSAVDFRPLCEVMENRKSSLLKDGKCNEYTSIKKQLQSANEFAASHSWVEIALSAAQARSIIASGKLALVLSLESTEPFDNRADYLNVLDEYRALGLRVYQLGSHINSRFAGASVMNVAYNTFMWAENHFRNGQCIDGGVLGNYCKYDDIPIASFADWLIGEDKTGYTCRDSAGAVQPCNAGAGAVNELGLTAEGRTLVAALMSRGMMLDLSHLSERSIAEVGALAKANSNYPLQMSHAHMRELLPASADHTAHTAQEKPAPPWVLDLIRDSGGMVGLRTGPDPVSTYAASGVPNDCKGSSRSFAQSLAYGADRGLQMAFGADFNGWIQQAVPRFDKSDEACRGDSSQQSAQTRNWTEPSGTTEDYLTDFDYPSSSQFDQYKKQGLAHVGLMRVFLEDLRGDGLKQEYLNNISFSAENFIQMWERSAPR